MYKYGMQARFGDCKSPKPAWYDVMAKNKYDNWMSVKGMDKVKAREAFIKLSEVVIKRKGYSVEDPKKAGIIAKYRACVKR